MRGSGSVAAGSLPVTVLLRHLLLLALLFSGVCSGKCKCELP